MGHLPAPDATVAPFRYFSLLSGVVLGFAAWGDIPDWRIAGGTALMTCSGLAMMKLERRNRRRAHA